MFTTVLDDSGRPAGAGVGPMRRLRLPFGAALGLHVCGVAFVLAARAWSLEEAPEPPIPIVFHDAPAPILGDGGDEAEPRKASSDAKTPGEPSPAEEKTVDTPALSADSVETVPETAGAAERTETPSTGDAGGTGSGTPGERDGRPDGVEKGKGTAPAASQIYEPGGDVLAPVLLVRVEPAYPDSARKLHTEGLVVVNAIISAAGIVEDVRVVKSAHPLLDASAVKAVQQWRYRPGTLNGRAVRVLLTVSVSFGLR